MSGHRARVPKPFWMRWTPAGMKAAFFVLADGTALDEVFAAPDRRTRSHGRLHPDILGTDHARKAARRQRHPIPRDRHGQPSGLHLDNGSEHLSATQQQELLNSGYRLWDASLDSRDHSYGPAAAAQTVTTALSQTTAPAVIRMGQYTATARTTELVCAYLSTYSIPFRPLPSPVPRSNNIT